MKRLVDLVGSGLGLLVLSPLLLAIGGAILVTMGRPVLFRQPRPGRNGQPFGFIKFRTMRHATGDGDDSDAARITPLGARLRSSSLDELPSLWNVFTGSMSLVGPRPLLMRYLERYSVEQARRHEVRPGVTGWAQVNGRNLISWDEKFRLDVWYVDNRSLWLDVRILVMTVAQVLGKRGISAEGHATMPEFMGNEGTETEGPSAI